MTQSLDLSIYRHKDYILSISTADQVDLVLSYLLMTADRCSYDIGTEINDMLSHLADRLSFMDLTMVSLSSFLVDCRIKSTGTLAYPKTSFGPVLELSRSPRPCIFRQHAFGTPGGTD